MSTGLDTANYELDGLTVERLAQAVPAPTWDTPTITDNGLTNPLSAGVSYAHDNTTAIRRVGCVGASFTFNSNNYIGNTSAGQAASAGGRPWAFEFVTSSAQVAFPIRAHIATPSVWVWVDGRPTKRVKTTWNVAAGNRRFISLTFPTAKERTIRVYLDRCDYGGLYVATGQTAVATAAREPFKLAVVRDSWGHDADTSVWPDHHAAAIGLAFGAETFINSIPGSGYVAGGTASLPYGHADRLAALYAAAPDVILIAGSANDRGQTESAVNTAAAALYAAIASNLPSAKVIVEGPQCTPSGTYPSDTNLLAVRDGVKAAALAAGSHVLGFVDPIVDRWLTGSGKETALAGDGNADRYLGDSGSHLSRAGGKYWAAREVVSVGYLLDRAGIRY